MKDLAVGHSQALSSKSLTAIEQSGPQSPGWRSLRPSVTQWLVADMFHCQPTMTTQSLSSKRVWSWEVRFTNPGKGSGGSQEEGRWPWSHKTFGLSSIWKPVKFMNLKQGRPRRPPWNRTCAWNLILCLREGRLRSHPPSLSCVSLIYVQIVDPVVI